MPPTNNQLHTQLRHTLQQLTHTHKTLQHYKTPNTQPPSHNQTTNPNKPTPQTPGGWATDLDIDITNKLHKLTTHIATHLTPHRTLNKNFTTLTNYLTFHLAPISELPTAQGVFNQLQGLLEYIRGCLKHHGALLDQPPPALTHQGTHYATATLLATAARAQGHQLTHEQLRQWVKRGKISNYKTPDGTTYYPIDAVINKLKQRG